MEKINNDSGGSDNAMMNGDDYCITNAREPEQKDSNCSSLDAETEDALGITVSDADDNTCDNIVDDDHVYIQDYGEQIPEEDPPRDGNGLIIGTTVQQGNKAERHANARQENINALISGQVPCNLYNSDTDEYDHFDGGIPDVKRYGKIVDLAGIISRSMDEYIREYRARHDGKNIILDQLLDECESSEIKADYFTVLNRFIKMFNGTADADGNPKMSTDKISSQKTFPIEAVSLLLISTKDLAILKAAGTDADLGIGYYHHTGEKAGLWAQGGLDKEDRYDFIVKVALLFGVNTNGAYYDKIYKALRANLPIIEVRNIDGVIPVKNGVVDIRQVVCTFNQDRTDWTGTGFEFTPYILDDGSENPEYLKKYKCVGFMAKLDTNFNPNATDKVIVNPNDGYEWSFMKGLREITEDGERKKIAVLGICQLINSCIRGKRLPHTVGLIDGSVNEGQEGGGGKTTVLDMIIYVIGERLVLPRSIDILCDGGFGLEGLEKCTIRVLICDESDSYDEKNGLKSGKTFKGLTRPNQNISVNPKGIKRKEIRTDMPAALAANKGIKFGTKDEAIRRPLIYIIFPHNFTNKGNEKSYIRDDYVKRPEVREYILLKTLSLGMIIDYSAEVIEVGKQYLNGMSADTYPVFEYMNGLRLELQGKIHPERVIFEDYKLWCKRTGHNSCAENEFIRQLRVWAKNFAPGWKVVDNGRGFYFPKDPPPELYAGRILEANVANDTTRKFLLCSDNGRGEWADRYKGKTAPGACLVCDDSYLDIQPVLSEKEENEQYCIWAAVNCMLEGKPWSMRRTRKEWEEKGKERIEFPIYNGEPRISFVLTSRPRASETETAEETI